MGAKDAKTKKQSVSLWIALGACALGISACFVGSYEVPSGGGESGGGSSTSTNTSSGSGSGSGGGSMSSGVTTGTGGGNVSSCGVGQTCVPSSVIGWEGPFEIRGGDPGTLANTCPDGSEPRRAYQNLTGGSGQPCACECNCSGVICPPPILNCFATSNCDPAGGPSSSTTLQAQACQGIPFLNNAPPAACKILPGQFTTPPNCAPQPIKLAAPWTSDFQACPLPVGETCADGICATGVHQGFKPMACVIAPGFNLTCPEGFKNLATVYQKVNDQRTCDGCKVGPDAFECGPPNVAAGVTCAATTGEITQECSPIVVTATNIAFTPGLATLHPDACSGQVSGTATATDPLTICCVDLL